MGLFFFTNILFNSSIQSFDTLIRVDEHSSDSNIGRNDFSFGFFRPGNFLKCSNNYKVHLYILMHL